MIIAGIDPGLKGSIVRYDTYAGTILSHHRMPITKTEQGKSEIDGGQLYRILSFANKIILEKVHAMPGQGVTSMFTFGMGYGLIKGVIQARSEEKGIELVEIHPATWKAYHGLLKQEKDYILNFVEKMDKSKEYAISKAEAYGLIKYYLKEKLS